MLRFGVRKGWIKMPKILARNSFGFWFMQNSSSGRVYTDCVYMCNIGSISSSSLDESSPDFCCWKSAGCPAESNWVDLFHFPFSFLFDSSVLYLVSNFHFFFLIGAYLIPPLLPQSCFYRKPSPHLAGILSWKPTLCCFATFHGMNNTSRALLALTSTVLCGRSELWKTTYWINSKSKGSFSTENVVEVCDISNRSYSIT